MPRPSSWVILCKSPDQVWRLFPHVHTSRFGQVGVKVSKITAPRHCVDKDNHFLVKAITYSCVYAATAKFNYVSIAYII